MNPRNSAFDLSALHRSLDAARQNRDLTWAAMAAEVGVSASTIRRLEAAADAEADGVLTLIAWLGLHPESFVPGATIPDRSVEPLRSQVVRVDMDAVRAANPAVKWRGSRTTIQRLAQQAASANVAIETLTLRSAT